MKPSSIVIVTVMLAAIPSPASATPDDKKATASQADRPAQSQSQSAERSRTVSGNVSSMDRQFAQKAASAGMMEVELGKIAQQNAASADVKAFGERMVTDHGKANSELKEVAASAGISLPADMTSEHKSHVNQLQNQKGAAFDRAYVQQMLKHHQKDVAEFEKASQSVTNADIKKFATGTLPTLREHLKEIQSIHSNMAGSEAGGKK
jgi:putative membrane protein